MHQLIESLTSFVLNTINAWGYAGVFALMTLESANIPIPSEVIMPFAGFLAAQAPQSFAAGQGGFGFWPVVFTGAFGNLFGSLVSYYLARYYGRRPLHFLARFHLTHERHEEIAESWFQKCGILSVFFARLLPVIRTFISYPAGMFGVDVVKFSLFTFIGSFLWSLFLTYLGYVLGANWELLRIYFQQFDYLIAGILIAAAVWWFWRGFTEEKELR